MAFTIPENGIRKIVEGYYSVESLSCPMCGEKERVTITAQNLWKYRQGALAQDIMPDVSPAIRERFMSGTCGNCYKAMLGIKEPFWKRWFRK